MEGHSSAIRKDRMGKTEDRFLVWKQMSKQQCHSFNEDYEKIGTDLGSEL